ncbi:MAG: lactate utilization protein [Sedimenticola sp.]
MSNARSNILIRLQSGRPELPEMTEETLKPRPERSLEERIDAFRRGMESVRGEVHIVDKNGWEEKLINLLQEKEVGTLLYGARTPLGKALEAAWQKSRPNTRLINRKDDVNEWKEELFFSIDAAITSTCGGIAETGSLILQPTVEEPRSYSLVPPIHIAVLEAQKLHNTFADVVTRENWSSGLPTNTLLISGPSKTADIEQTLAYGVHGPVELVVLLLT